MQILRGRAEGQPSGQERLHSIVVSLQCRARSLLCPIFRRLSGVALLQLPRQFAVEAVAKSSSCRPRSRSSATRTVPTRRVSTKPNKAKLSWSRQDVLQTEHGSGSGRRHPRHRCGPDHKVSRLCSSSVLFRAGSHLPSLHPSSQKNVQTHRHRDWDEPEKPCNSTANGEMNSHRDPHRACDTQWHGQQSLRNQCPSEHLVSTWEHTTARTGTCMKSASDKQKWQRR